MNEHVLTDVFPRLGVHQLAEPIVSKLTYACVVSPAIDKTDSVLRGTLCRSKNRPPPGRSLLRKRCTSTLDVVRKMRFN